MTRLLALASSSLRLSLRRLQRRPAGPRLRRAPGGDERATKARIIILAALVAEIALNAPGAEGQTVALQGIWRSGETTMRVIHTMGEIRGLFATVSNAARALGFKPGDVSFNAAAVENYLHGVQTLRYGGGCYPNGRRVPMMARLTPDGHVMAIHTYEIRLDNLCRDTGEFSISETLWHRVQ